MRGLEQEYSPLVAFFWCVFTLLFFVSLVVLMPPIIVAAGYTAMSIVVYRICHITFAQMNYGGSDINNTVAAFVCAAAWPLYFFFGAYMFLRRTIRRE